MAGERKSRIKIRVENMEFDVVGDDFQQVLAAVKALPDRRFNGDLKIWEVSASEAMVRGQLENSGFLMEGGTPVSAEQQAAAPGPTSSDRIKVDVAGYNLLVTGAPFQTMLEAIKAMPDRRFDGETKQWTIGGTMAEARAYFAEKSLQLQAQPGQPEPPITSVGDVPTDEASSASWLQNQPTFAPSTSQTPPPPPPSDFPPPDDDFGGYYDEDDHFDEFFPPSDPIAAPPDAVPPVIGTETEQKSSSGRTDRIKIVVGNMPMVVMGGSFKDMLAAIKALPNRRFDGSSKQWLIDEDLESVQQHLVAHGFQMDRDLGA